MGQLSRRTVCNTRSWWKRRPPGENAPNLIHTEHIAPCHRPTGPGECNRTGTECDLSRARQLEYVIKQVGAENVAAFVAEPVVGATLGASPASDGYFQTIREICDRYDVLFIADEVMSGFGRTGEKMGIDYWGVKPDLIACAKGIAGGYTPLGAVIATPEIVGEVRGRGASFVIGHTASGMNSRARPAWGSCVTSWITT